MPYDLAQAVSAKMLHPLDRRVARAHLLLSHRVGPVLKPLVVAPVHHVQAPLARRHPDEQEATSAVTFRDPEHLDQRRRGDARCQHVDEPALDGRIVQGRERPGDRPAVNIDLVNAVNDQPADRVREGGRVLRGFFLVESLARLSWRLYSRRMLSGSRSVTSC